MGCAVRGNIRVQTEVDREGLQSRGNATLVCKLALPSSQKCLQMISLQPGKICRTHAIHRLCGHLQPRLFQQNGTESPYVGTNQMHLVDHKQDQLACKHKVVLGAISELL